MYYQTTTGLTDTTTAAITTAKYRESAPGVLASGNFNTGLIPAGLPKDQFENATFGGITWVLYTEGAPGSRDIKYYLSTNGGANFTGPNNLAVTTVDEYFFDIKSYAYSPGGVDVVYFKDSAGATNSSDKLLYTNASTTTPTSFTAPEQISEHVPVADSKFITPELIEYYNATGDVAALWVGLNGTTPNVYFDRLSAVVGVENKNNEIPSAYKLEQNYPNPFNPKTVIEFSIPKNELVTLKLYDILGREVMTLLNKEMTAGSYKLDFDGTGISSGVYFYKLVSGDFTDTKKFILAK